MTLDLDAIEARVKAHASAIGPGGDKAWNAGLLAADVPKLLAEVRRLRAPEPTGPTLTPEQRNIVALLADGHTLTAIGRRLGITKSAAAMRANRIYNRLGARNAANAVAIAIRAGLLPAYNPGARQQ